MSGFNQKNIFGHNRIFSDNKEIKLFFTKERTQRFFAGIVVTIFTIVVSGIIIEFFKSLFL